MFIICPFFLFSDYEWESYDGWYNNPAHPEWGGADMPMERKTPIAYPDGVYEFAGRDRPNVLIIANLSQNGLTGQGSDLRTGFFIYFGMISIILIFLLANFYFIYM